jgi:uncharacterized membrane-anchored protein
MWVTSLRLISLLLIGLTLVVAAPAAAQDKPADTNAILRAKLQGDKKLVVADNMDLSESEAKGFWPVYDAYQADLQKSNDRIVALIKRYAELYKSDADDSAADQRVRDVIDERLAIEADEVQRDRSYVPKLMAVLPPRKVMRYLQIEAKVRAVIRYGLADRIPLVE